MCTVDSSQPSHTFIFFSFCHTHHLVSTIPAMTLGTVMAIKSAKHFSQSNGSQAVHNGATYSTWNIHVTNVSTLDSCCVQTLGGGIFTLLLTWTSLVIKERQSFPFSSKCVFFPAVDFCCRAVKSCSLVVFVVDFQFMSRNRQWIESTHCFNKYPSACFHSWQIFISGTWSNNPTLHWNKSRCVKSRFSMWDVRRRIPVSLQILFRKVKKCLPVSHPNKDQAQQQKFSSCSCNFLMQPQIFKATYSSVWLRGYPRNELQKGTIPNWELR